LIIGDSFQIGIVQHDHQASLAESYVEFDAGRALLQCGAERQQRILGGVAPGAAMTEDLRVLASSPRAQIRLATLHDATFP
jgi:hypothetical protein